MKVNRLVIVILVLLLLIVTSSCGGGDSASTNTVTTVEEIPAVVKDSVDTYMLGPNTVSEYYSADGQLEQIVVLKEDGTAITIDETSLMLLQIEYGD
jgi:hypothetical protein